MESKSVFLISNGSSNYFPKNTLTNFRNKLPEDFDVNDYEVAVKSIGFSTVFKEIKTPENGFPSFFISKNLLPTYGFTPSELVSDGSEPQLLQIKTLDNPPDLSADKTESLCQNGSLCLDLLNGEFKELSLKPFDFDNRKVFQTPLTRPYFFKESETYSSGKLTDFFDRINLIENSNISYKNGALTVELQDQNYYYDTPILNSYWFVCHETFIDTFNIKPYNNIILTKKMINKLRFDPQTIDKSKTLPTWDDKNDLPDFCEHSKINYEREERTYFVKLNSTKVYFKGEVYYAFHIQSPLHYIKSSIDIDNQKYPELLKIKSRNIKSQILNDSHSKDLVVFCPDFNKKATFFYHEFDSLQYIRLENTSLRDFEINICDDKDKFLQLAPGTPSIVKLSFRKMEKSKESFNVRLSSTKNSKYPKNTSTSFRVELPNTLNLDRSWKVALTSISHPNNFTTFLADEDSRTLQVLWREENGTIMKHRLIMQENYETAQELFDELKQFFVNNDLGSVNYHLNRICLKFKRPCLFSISNYLLRVLGFTHLETLHSHRKFTTYKILFSTPFSFIKTDENSSDILFCFQEEITLKILDPKYICIYANFISPTILGGEYHKILRIIPIRESKTGYIISEFKHKEFHELQNTEIRELEIELRAHDGELINFKSKQNIILNLLFSNYIED